MFVLIAGPIARERSDDPEKMTANLRRLEEASWPLFEVGHLPVIGEWVALPAWHAAGGKHLGDVLYDQVFYPTARRLLDRVDVVLRVPSTSTGADQDVRLAEARGAPVVHGLEEVPGVRATWLPVIRLAVFC